MSETPPGPESSESLESASAGDGGPNSDIWMWDSSQLSVDHPTNETEFKVAKIQAWKHRDGVKPRTQYIVESFETESAARWIEKTPPLLDDRAPSSGFKLLVLPCDGSSNPYLTKEQENRLHSACGLPNFLGHARSAQSGACGMFSLDDDNYVFIVRKSACNNGITTAFRYDGHTNVTRGFFYAGPRVEPTDFERIPAQFLKCSHPLLLLLLALEIQADRDMDELVARHATLVYVEQITGYRLDSYSNAPGNYRDLIKQLGEAQVGLHWALADITVSVSCTRFIRQKLQDLNDVLPKESATRLDPFCKMLEERIDFFQSNLELAQSYSGVKERMELQHTVLYSLIAQSDSLANIELAKSSRETAVASKQDSSAMKIIALLTTFFLPGTFVATFFAMPLFDWTKSSISDIASGHFWVYWAVTGPLTLSTMAGVAALFYWLNKRNERLQREAQAGLGGSMYLPESPASSSEEESTLSTPSSRLSALSSPVPGSLGSEVPAAGSANEEGVVDVARDSSRRPFKQNFRDKRSIAGILQRRHRPNTSRATRSLSPNSMA